MTYDRVKVAHNTRTMRHRLRSRALFHFSTFPLATAAFLIAVLSAMGHAQAPRTVQDGVYTDAQAARGQALFKNECAGCHGAELQGAQGPPLKGEGFLLIRQPESLWDLASKIRNTMPPGVQGAVNAAQAADLVAHILKTGGFKPGAAELASAEDVLTRIRWPHGTWYPL